ncbi:hypothetical protein HHJ49_00010 [Escherichia coli]|nr:hypothetical protein HHJ49_00010 [Escherichia coli]
MVVNWRMLDIEANGNGVETPPYRDKMTDRWQRDGAVPVTILTKHHCDEVVRVCSMKW